MLSSLLWKGSMFAGFAVVAMAILAPPNDEAPVAAARSRSNQELIRDLRDSRGSLHSPAYRELLAREADAIPDLLAALEHPEFRVDEFILSILQEHLVSSDPSLAEAATLALENLTESPRLAVATRALHTLQGNYAVLQSRALGELEQHGARPGVSDLNAREAHPYHVDFVLLTNDWDADAGMKALKRLQRWRLLYLEDGVELSDANQAALRRRHPALMIRRRNDACLGIAGENRASGFAVTFVDPLSGAAQAGLQSGDIVTHFDGQPADTVQKLVTLVAARKAGDVAPVTLLRDGESQLLHVPLGNDFATGRCRCDCATDSDE